MAMAAAVLCGPVGVLRAQPGVTVREVVGARARGLGGAGVALAGEVWRNPAGIAGLRRADVRLYGDRAFLVPELQLASLVVAAPLAGGGVGIAASSYGYEDFRATGAALVVARGLSFGTSRRIEAGVAVGAQRVALGGGYGSATGVTVDVGLRAALTPRLDAGARAVNVLGGGLGDAPFPRRLDVGVAFAATPALRVVADAGQVVGAGLVARGGAEVRLADVLVLRVGGGSNPETLAAGLGLALGRTGIDLSFARTADLGWTPAAELRMSF